jgi:hypothetical protein
MEILEKIKTKDETPVFQFLMYFYSSWSSLEKQNQ